jgi:1,4-dihydroxy-2-naphthoate octaprenyltransferase
MQAGANLVNDVKDAERGVDTTQRLGPARMTQSGLLQAREVRHAYRSVFAASLILGSALAWLSGPAILGVAAIACLVAYSYTSGPFPLSYHGLGEVFAFVFFGPIAVAGSYYLQVSEWQWLSVLCGLGPGFIAASMMAINNHRDRSTDDLAGKRTLSLKLGFTWSQRLPLLFLYAAILQLPICAWALGSLWPGLILGGAALLFVVTKIYPLVYGSSESLNLALKQTAKFQGLFALAFIVLLLSLKA